MVIASAGLIVSYFLTWELWQVRGEPPNLPALSGLRSLHFGIPLVLASLSAVFLPRLGATLHAVLLVAAALGDQIRLQPEFVSLAILLLGAAWPVRGLYITRWHLVALWAWAGIHKVLSGGWPAGEARFIADALRTPGLRPAVAVVVPLIEIGLAILALAPPAWKVLRWAAPAFHVGVVIVLALEAWNTAVWPWNVCLAVAAPLLFSRVYQQRASVWPRVRREAIPAVAPAAFLALSPVGFYFGINDAYLAHNLYTGNTADAFVRGCEPPGVRCRPSFSTFSTLNVPLPPEKRLFTAWFGRICRQNETLVVNGRWTRLAKRTVSLEPCRR